MIFDDFEIPAHVEEKNERIVERVYKAMQALPASPSARSVLAKFEEIKGFLHKRPQMKIGVSYSKRDLDELAYALPISSLRYFQRYVKEFYTEKIYKEFDRFFKTYCKAARKATTASPQFETLLRELGLKQFLEVVPENARKWEWYANVPFNHEIARWAYNRVLDFYDCNVSEKATWSGYWSLINTRNGEITGVYLGDTVDIELFWEYVEEYPKTKKP